MSYASLRFRRLLPRSLMLRTFLLIALLILLSTMAWVAIFTFYEREPRARQMSQLVSSVVNLTRSALISARPEARVALLRDLSIQEGIHIYPAEPDDRIEPLPPNPFLERADELIRAQLGADTRITLEREGERALFVSFRIDDDEYWVALPRDRFERFIPWQWIGWCAAALLISLIGAWLIMFRVTRPLQRLARAALEIGRGRTPPPLPVDGPGEIATLAIAFNQMNADLARMDSDRATILAGISHDLRTPLTRMRMDIALSGMDEATQQSMEVDIEEMDKTIGQFLDFAKSDGGEIPVAADMTQLLEELALQYRRRGAHIELSIETDGTLCLLRVQAVRRAIANLIGNALRYAGRELPISLRLQQVKESCIVEVADRGPGIPADEVERLKLPFTRLENARSNTAGAGLGLAIVERIARSHQGSLELLPREGGGLLARLSLHSLAAD